MGDIWWWVRKALDTQAYIMLGWTIPLPPDDPVHLRPPPPEKGPAPAHPERVTGDPLSDRERRLWRDIQGQDGV